MARRIVIDLDEVEEALLDMLLHDLRQNDPCGHTNHDELVHDIVSQVLEDDYAMNSERIRQGVGLKVN